MAFADLLDRLGGMGRFQYIQVTLICVPIILMANHSLLQNFAAGIPLHHCRVVQYKNSSYDGNYTILTDRDLVRVYIPLAENQKADKCLQFTQPQWGLLHQNATADNLTGVGTQPCTDGWTYDTSVFTNTIITEWNLVCHQQALSQMAQSIYMAGVLAGAVIFGSLADRYGRRTLLIWSYLQMAVTGTCVAYSPNMIAYCALRFFTGMALSGFGISTGSLILPPAIQQAVYLQAGHRAHGRNLAIVLVASTVIEWSPKHMRTIVGTAAGYFYTLGQFLLAGLAYTIPNWRHLQIAISVPFFLFFLYSWWFPESARWLVLVGKSEQAVNALRKVAKINRKVVEGEKINTETLKMYMEKEITTSKSTYSPIDLVRTPNLRWISICIGSAWFSTSFSYYGLAMDLQNFGDNIYLTQIIFGVVDIPAKLISTIAMSYIGRRITQTTTLVLAGTAILANVFVPYEMKILRTSFAVIGKGCLSASFNTCFLFTSELYPTVIRQSALGFASTMARVGGIVAPMVKITSKYISYLPLIIYGCAAVISGIIVCFLPETLNEALPDTIEQVESKMKKTKTQRKEEPAEEIFLQKTVKSAC